MENAEFDDNNTYGLNSKGVNFTMMHFDENSFIKSLLTTDKI